MAIWQAQGDNSLFCQSSLTTSELGRTKFCLCGAAGQRHHLSRTYFRSRCVQGDGGEPGCEIMREAWELSAGVFCWRWQVMDGSSCWGWQSSLEPPIWLLMYCSMSSKTGRLRAQRLLHHSSPSKLGLATVAMQSALTEKASWPNRTCSSKMAPEP
jgi:hypothetical protein